MTMTQFSVNYTVIQNLGLFGPSSESTWSDATFQHRSACSTRFRLNFDRM